MTENNDKINNSPQKLKPHFQKIEIVLALLALLGLALKMNQIIGGEIILISSLGLLSMLYVFSAFFQTEAKDDDDSLESYSYEMFTTKLTGFSYAVIIVGILFWIQNWPKQTANLYAGIAVLIVSLLIHVVKLENYRPIPKILLFITLALGMLIYPKPALKSNTHPVENRE